MAKIKRTNKFIRVTIHDDYPHLGDEFIWINPFQITKIYENSFYQNKNNEPCAEICISGSTHSIISRETRDQVLHLIDMAG